MHWMLTFGSVAGAVEHLATDFGHALKNHSWSAALLALIGFGFFIRHYGVATLADLGRLLRWISVGAKSGAKIVNGLSSRLNLSLDGKSDKKIRKKAMRAQYAKMPALVQIRRRQRQDAEVRGVFAAGISAIIILLGTVIYHVVDTKEPEQKVAQLKPPAVVIFSARFGALYSGLGEGGPETPAAKSLDRFLGKPRVAGVPHLSDPWNFKLVNAP